MLIRKCIFLLMKNTNHHLSLSASHSLFCNSNIKDYWSQITIASIIIMEKFEMWELSKCDTEERNEQMLLEKWHPSTSAIQDCHKFVKKKKGNKTKCACNAQGWCALGKWLSKHGPWTISLSITQELVRNIHSQFPPQTHWIRNSRDSIQHLFSDTFRTLWYTS